MRAEFETRALHLQPCEVIIAGTLTTATKKVLSHLSINTYPLPSSNLTYKNLLHRNHTHRIRLQTQNRRSRYLSNQSLLRLYPRRHRISYQQNPHHPPLNPSRFGSNDYLYHRLRSSERIHVEVLPALFLTGTHVAQWEYDK
jgi:replication initiation and membrane attachment protein DnaB